MFSPAYLRRLMCCLTALLLLGAAGWWDAGLARHQKVYAVPVPGKVVIDGKLDDWDLSGQIFQYVTSENSAMQSARFALMYDKDALYISGVLRDPHPMMNRHDPNIDPDKAWDADVCQIFLPLDPALGYPLNKSAFNKDETDKMCTLILWYFTDRKEPNLVALKAMSFNKPLRPDLSKTGVIPRDKFQAAYRMADDKKGYTFEYRIPWSTLGVKTNPKAGDMLAGTVCFFWGTADGFKTAGGSAWCYDVMAGPGFPYQSSACWGKVILSPKGNLPKELVEEGQPPEKPLPLQFSYTLPEDGEVTVTLFNDQGKIVRTLAASAARRAGENVERWDGLGDDGKPLPAGAYSWKGLYHQPIKTKFILSAHNSGQPPYKLDDRTGGWGGDHGCPTSVSTSGDAVIMGWSMSESGWGIIKTDLNGKQKWGLTHNAMDLACDDSHIFVLGDNGFNGAESVKIFDLKDGRLLNWGNGKPVLDPPAGGDEKSNVAGGVAYRDGKVYVSWTARDLIAVYDVKSGDLLQTRHAPSPARLAVRADGGIYYISDTEVHLLLGDNDSVLKSPHFDHPRGIAVTPDDTWLVANAGALQNVSVFAKDGTYVRSIGTLGGRPRVGRYDPDGMLEPGGIAVDKLNRLWVSETLDGPKRHSVWDINDGRLAA